MSNPWEEISLNDYENHMSLDSVKQLQIMNSIMKEQFEDYPYLHAFDGLDEVHHQMDEDSLLTKMQEIGYKDILQARIPLPNGRAFIRMDFQNGKMG